jgi:hypothetical protein
VSLLLRINPRRYDAVHVAAVHRLLAAPPAPGEGDAIGAAPLVARLLQLTDLLARWRESSAAIGHELERAHATLLRSLDEQNASLQRMLYDAGVTREQLTAIVGEVAGDAALRVELWALAEELLWQLHAAANQLKRRWQALQPSAPHPRALAAWFDAVAALDGVAPAAA